MLNIFFIFLHIACNDTNCFHCPDNPDICDICIGGFYQAGDPKLCVEVSSCVEKLDCVPRGCELFDNTRCRPKHCMEGFYYKNGRCIESTFLIADTNGKVIRVTALVVTTIMEDVEACLQSFQWQPGQSSWWPLHFSGLCKLNEINISLILVVEYIHDCGAISCISNIIHTQTTYCRLDKSRLLLRHGHHLCPSWVIHFSQKTHYSVIGVAIGQCLGTEHALCDYLKQCWLSSLTYSSDRICVAVTNTVQIFMHICHMATRP